MFKTFFVSMTLAAALQAAPLTITEPPDHAGTGGNSFALGLGANTFSGTVSGCPNCGGDYQDNFVIVLPVGYTVTSGFLSASVDTGGGPNAQLACFTSAGCVGTGFFSGMSTSAFNNPDRSFSFTATSGYSIPSVEIAGSSTYTLTYNVALDTTPGSGVPEPGTFVLLAAGLAAIAWRRTKV